MLRRFLFYLLSALRNLIIGAFNIFLSLILLMSVIYIFWKPETWPYCLAGFVIAFLLYCLTWVYDEVLLKIKPRSLDIILFR